MLWFVAAIVILILALTFFVERARRGEPPGTYRHHPLMAWLGTLCLALSLLAGGAYFYDADIYVYPTEFLSATLLFIVFGIVAVYFLGEYFFVQVSVDEEGIELVTLWSGRKSARWDDLESTDYAKFMGWVVLRFRTGEVMRLSGMLKGIAELFME